MQQLLTPETFEFFARFVLAGFVFLAARARFVVGERPKPTETLMEAVVLSLFNQLVFVGILSLVPAQIVLAPTMALYLEVLILPVILGGLAGYLLSRNWMPGGVRRLFMPIARPVPDAYEYAFLSVDTPCFILVAFHDNREVYAYFGEASLASSNLHNGGIFLERLYNVSESGEWVQVSPFRSAWLSMNDVHSIEFFDVEGEKNAESID